MNALLDDLLLFNDRGDEVWSHSPAASAGLVELTRSRITSGSVRPGSSGTFVIVFEISRLQNPGAVNLTDQQGTLEIDLEDYVDASFGG